MNGNEQTVYICICLFFIKLYKLINILKLSDDWENEFRLFLKKIKKFQRSFSHEEKKVCFYLFLSIKFLWWIWLSIVSKLIHWYIDKHIII